MGGIVSINLPENGTQALPNTRLQFGELPLRQRLQLVWEIWWPCASIATFVLLVQRLLGLREGNPAETASSLLIFFVFSPWVIRRAVKLDFPGFNLVVIRHNGTKTRAMNYWESLSVNWLFTVRALLLLIPLLIAALLVGKMLGMPNPFPLSEEPRSAVAAILFHVIGEATSFILFLVWLISAATKKQYSEFVLKFEGRTSL